MFQAASNPKEQPEESGENETSHSRTQGDEGAITTPSATSSDRSVSRSQDHERTPTASEGPSFHDGGLVTSTPAPVPAAASRDSSQIFTKSASPTSSYIESAHERLRRDIDNLQIDNSSITISELSTTDNAPIPSISNLSISSLSSTQSSKDTSSSANKGKGRSQELRSKPVQNMALQRPKGSIFTKEPSNVSFNAPSFTSDTSLREAPAAKPPIPIFSGRPNPKTAPNFTRIQQQIFAPLPGPSSLESTQQRMLRQLLKEAEDDKRAGLPIGSFSPARSPARLNVLRQEMANAGLVSISTDNDTLTTADFSDRDDVYRSEVFGVRNYEVDDGFDESDSEMEEVGYFQGENISAKMTNFDTENNNSFDSTGWQSKGDTRAAGYNNDTLFGLGNRAASGGNFELQDALRGTEPDSFALESPIPARLGGVRH